MPANPARLAASHLIEAVLERGRTLEDALDALPAMAARDKAAGHRIAAAVLRRLGTLDAVLEPWLRRQPPAPARRALRIAAAELLILGTPAHAAVSASVSVVPKPLAGVVNAVSRRLAEAGPAALEGLDAERLDTPAWLWSAWHAAHGPAVRAIARAHGDEAPLDLTLKPGAPPPPGGEALPGGTLRFPAGTRITELPGFAEGHFWAQDQAAAIPARLLDARLGEFVADLCAAPGGKTAQLAAAGARVVAVERDGERIPRLRENLARLGLAAEMVEADARQWRPPEPLDAALLDAPCTATGTIRRHPDIPHLRRPTDVAKLATLQHELLRAAASMLRPGGRLVFATCSLQAEEGEHHLRDLPAGLSVEEVVRTRPDQGMDGFFVARLRRG